MPTLSQHVEMSCTVRAATSSLTPRTQTNERAMQPAVRLPLGGVPQPTGTDSGLRGVRSPVGGVPHPSGIGAGRSITWQMMQSVSGGQHQMRAHRGGIDDFAAQILLAAAGAVSFPQNVVASRIPMMPTFANTVYDEIAERAAGVVSEERPQPLSSTFWMTSKGQCPQQMRTIRSCMQQGALACITLPTRML